MKTFQRFLGIALTMLLMAAFPNSAAAVSDAEQTAMQIVLANNSKTVFFDMSTASSWTKAYCYWFYGDNNNQTNNNGGEEMTQLISSSSIYYYSYNENSTGYSASYTPSKVMFNNGGWGNGQTADGGFDWADGALYNYSGASGSTYTAASTGTTTYTITYTNPNSWDNVYCYIWKKVDGVTTTYVGKFPGSAMSGSGTSWTYSFTTTEELTNYWVIFTDGTSQTDDLTLNTASGTNYTVTASDESGEGGDSEGGDSEGGDSEGGDSEGGDAASSVSAAGNLYLVGNFLATDTENAAFKYSFRLDKQTDNNGSTYYSILIPATLSDVNFSLAMSNGTGYTYYGNTSTSGSTTGSTYNFTSTNPAASTTAVDTASVSGYIVEDTETNPSYYWSLASAHANYYFQDGTYEFKVWLDADGVPSSWTMSHINNLRIAYIVQNPDEKTNPVVQVAKMYSTSSGGYDDRHFGYLYLEKDKHAYVLANTYIYAETGYDQEYTTSKLYSQGSYSDDLGVCDGAGGEDYNKCCYVYPAYGYGASTTANNKGFKISTTSNMGATLEYNPTKGRDDYGTRVTATTGGRNDQIMGGELISSSKTSFTSITSFSLIGDITGGWTSDNEETTSDPSDELPMAWNDDEDCYTVTITTTADNGTQKFRFIANGSWNNNFGEDGTTASYLAKVDYTDSSADGHAATEEDPNEVSLYDSRTVDDGATYNAYDIIFNRPAGVWTIKFYIESNSISTGSDAELDQVYRYTITAEAGDTVSATYLNKQFICTYASAKAMNLQDGIKAYVAYSYTTSDTYKEATEGSTTSATEGTLNMRRMSYVPANVGVLLIAHVDSLSRYFSADTLKNSQMYDLRNFLWERTETSATDSASYCKLWTQYTANSYSSDSWHDYLLPGTGGEIANDNASDNSGAAHYEEDGTISERYFVLSLYSDTKNGTGITAGGESDFFGFFRFISGTPIPDYRSYLYLPKSDSTEGETYGGVSYSSQILSGVTGTDDTSSSEVEESKGVSRMIFDDMEGDEEAETESAPTDITTVQETVVSTGDNAYYTLQGIRVNTPSRGIYIHNGKKIIFQ